MTANLRFAYLSNGNSLYHVLQGDNTRDALALVWGPFPYPCRAPTETMNTNWGRQQHPFSVRSGVHPPSQTKQRQAPPAVSVQDDHPGLQLAQECQDDQRQEYAELAVDPNTKDSSEEPPHSGLR